MPDDIRDDPRGGYAILASLNSRVGTGTPICRKALGVLGNAPDNRTIAAMAETGEYRIQPQLNLRDGRIIRSLGDAMTLLREHESRPGIDKRDEVLHGLERAQTDEQRQKAAAAFFAWAKELDLILRQPKQARRA